MRKNFISFAVGKLLTTILHRIPNTVNPLGFLINQNCLPMPLSQSRRQRFGKPVEMID